MQETRRARLAAVIQQELSVEIRGLKDPRIPLLTVTSVEVSQDAGTATVMIALLGSGGEKDEAAEKKHQKEIRECLEGLTSASGYLRRHLGGILTIRHIPSLVFKEDRGLENSLRVNELLKQIQSNKPAESTDKPSENE